MDADGEIAPCRGANGGLSVTSQSLKNRGATKWDDEGRLCGCTEYIGAVPVYATKKHTIANKVFPSAMLLSTALPRIDLSTTLLLFSRPMLIPMIGCLTSCASRLRLVVAHQKHRNTMKIVPSIFGYGLQVRAGRMHMPSRRQFLDRWPLAHLSCDGQSGPTWSIRIVPVLSVMNMKDTSCEGLTRQDEK